MTLVIFSLTYCILSPAVPAWTAGLVVAALQEPASLDPHQDLDPYAWTYIFPCYQRLVGFKARSTEPAPSLAATWRVSDDGRLYTFIIKEGFTFSDGKPVNAEAVRFSFSRATRLNRAGPAAFPYLSGLEVLGPNTIRFHLDRPWPAFPAALATAPASIVSPGIQDQPPGFLDRRSLGSGLYTVKDWRAGREIVLEARTDLVSRPRIDRLQTLLVSRQDQLREMLCDGRVDLALNLDQDTVLLIKDEPRLEVQTAATCHIHFLALNVRRPWLDRVEARRALAQAIDRQQLIETAGDTVAMKMFGPIPKGLWGRHPDLAQYDYSPREASSLLDSNGRPGRDLIFLYNPVLIQTKVAETIRLNLETLGLKTVLLPSSTPEARTRWASGDYDLLLSTWRPVQAAPEAVLEKFFSPEAIGPEDNAAFYRNLDVGRLLKEAYAQNDKRRRLSLLHQIQIRVVEDVPYVFLYQSGYRVGLSRNFQGYYLNPHLPEVLPLDQMGPAPTLKIKPTPPPGPEVKKEKPDSKEAEKPETLSPPHGPVEKGINL
ncbi:MAG: ABC transporter substrate-binding protein [Thermodesulfobacteriota bacterium]